MKICEPHELRPWTWRGEARPDQWMCVLRLSCTPAKKTSPFSLCCFSYWRELEIAGNQVFGEHLHATTRLLPKRLRPLHPDGPSDYFVYFRGLQQSCFWGAPSRDYSLASWTTTSSTSWWSERLLHLLARDCIAIRFLWSAFSWLLTCSLNDYILYILVVQTTTSSTCKGLHTSASKKVSRIVWLF